MSERSLSVFKKALSERFCSNSSWIPIYNLHKNQYYYPYKQKALNAKWLEGVGEGSMHLFIRADMKNFT